MTDLDNISLIGYHEKFITTLHDRGFYNSVSVTGIYSVYHPACQNSTALKSIIRVALEQTVNTHPNLWLQIKGTETKQSTPEGISKGPYFVQLEHINLETVIRFLGFDMKKMRTVATEKKTEDEHLNLQELLENESNKGFRDSSLPLWRLLVATNVELPQSLPDFSSTSLNGLQTHLVVIFSSHHAIADGLSGNVFHATFLNALNSFTLATLNNCEDQLPLPHFNPIIYLPSTTSFTPSKSMEELLEYKVSWISRFQNLISYFARLRPSANKWTGKPYVAPSALNPVITGMKLIFLGGESMKRLREKCRHQNTSVTSLFHVVISESIFQVLDHHWETLRIATALNVRRFIYECKDINYRMGLWIDAFETECMRAKVCESLSAKYTSAESLNWAEVRRHKRAIDEHVRKGDCDLSFISLHGNGRNYEKELLELHGKVRNNSFSVTNLGVFPSPMPADHIVYQEDMPWKLEKVVLSQSAHANGSAIQFCFASTERGGLAISLNWQKSIVGDTVIHAIAEKLKKRLQTLAEM